MTRLRILSVINALYFGGAECRLLALSKGIDRDGFEHRVLTFKRPDAEREQRFGSLRPHFAAANITVESLNEAPPQPGSAHGTAVKVARSLPRLTSTAIKLARYVRENDIDVIDAHIGTGNHLGIAAGRLTGRPAIITTYGIERFAPDWLWRLSQRAILSGAAVVVTDSEPVASQLRERLPSSKTVAVIPNGIEPPRSERSRDEMHAQLGIPLDPRVRVIGQVGSLTPRKGQLFLLDAAQMLAERDPHLHFVICGYARQPFDYERALHARADELGLRSRVHFVGYPGSIGDIYRAIDIQVHAATQESLPQAIIEGMALGKPAVVTAIAGIPSLVSDGITGLVVPPGDSGALVVALRRLLADDAFARQLGAAAQRRYAERYTDAQMTRRLEDLFLDVARRRTAAS